MANGGDTGDTEITYNLTWNSAATSVLIEYAGHLALSGSDNTGIGWGPGNGSSNVNGGPYHMNLGGLDGQGGSLDNQIQGAGILIPQGSITIIKDAVPNDAQDFAYTTTGTGLSPFSLDDDTNATLSNTRVFSNLANGTYSVTESLPVAGWDLTNLVCVDPVNPGATTTNTGTGLSTIVLSAGENVVCTYTNTKRGRIIVDKVTNPLGDPQSFSFTTTGAGYTGFSLTDAAAPNNQELAAGAYSVAETIPSGWDLTNTSCVSSILDTENAGALELDPGETITCTFTNTKRGRIIVDKVTNPTLDPQSFAFTTTGAGYVGFSLTDAAAPNNQEVVPGSYTVGETVPMGWDLTSAVCDMDETPASLDVGPGETVTCTFNNEKDALIIIDKVTNPAGDAQLFDFTTSYGAPFQLADATTPNNSGDLSPGTYSAAETVPAGWDQTGVTCSDGSPVGAISLQAGETVTCTFNNEKDAFIIIDKVTNPAGDAQLFDFTTSYGAPFQLADATTPNNSGDLSPGTYSAAETVPAGWDQTGVTCSDGSPVGAISLQAGETVTCTFNNEKDAFIIIDKVTNPAGDAQLFDFTTSYGAPFQLADATTPNNSGDLSPGTYSAAETVPAGWDQTGVTCSDGSPVGAISLQAGETVTCTFNNEKDAFIIIDKVTNPAGDAQLFDFTTSYGAPFQLADATTPNNSGDLSPGTYSAAETVPAGWDQTGVTCSDGSPVGAISLQAGETVTCTFNNEKDAFIIIDKVTNPAGDAQLFDFTTSYGAPFQLADATTPNNSGDLSPGTYSAAETVPAGWDQTGVTCSDGSPVGAISLQAGETVTCTFNNEKDAFIIIDKVTNPAGDAQLFDFTTSYGAPFQLADATTPNNSGDLSPGTYSAAETVPAGWDQTGVTCSDGSPVGAISLQAGETVTCTFNNEKDAFIIIDKVTNPAGDAQLFDFTTSYGAPFQLADATTPNNSGDLSPGTYSAAETVPAGWDQTGVTCSDGSPVGAISLQAGETVTCTFNNEKDAFIIIDKVTNPAGDAQLFDFTTSYGAPFQLADATTPNNSGDLSPGTYSAAETVPAGWDQTGVTCSDGSPVGAISLQAGETVTCTFNNEKDAFIIIDKVTNPAGDAQLFDFTTSYGAPFQLADATTPNNSGDLSPGTYSAAETVPAGWDQTGVTCSDGSPVGAISLQAGETVTCTFNNEKDAFIIIDKVTNPAGDAQLFDFTTSYGAPFQLADATTPNNSGDLSPGTYSAAETVPAGWDQTGVTCSDGSPVGAISLQAGETVTCTFNNEKDAFIIIDKVTNPAGDAQLFDFTTSYGAPFQLADATTPNNSGDLSPGTYSAAETVPAGWDQTGVTCSDGSPVGAISLQAGETVTCTFNNEKDAFIIIDKVTNPAGDAQLFDFTTSYGAPFQLADATTPNNSGDLSPGTYSAAETVPAGWDQTGVTCSDGSPVGAISLQAGETVTCTFNNEKDAFIIIDKVTNPAGDASYSISRRAMAHRSSLPTRRHQTTPAISRPELTRQPRPFRPVGIRPV